MIECSKQENQNQCNCSYPCDKKGLCCECISYHRQRGELPACYFPNEIERTYNRSIENYFRTCKK